MRLRVALAISAALFYAVPAYATIDPPAASNADSRMRIVTYDPNNPVQLMAAPGATLRIQFGRDETVVGVVVSDQGTISPPMEAAPTGAFSGLGGGLAASGSRAPPSCDPNLCRSVIGNFVYLKPLRALDPQPVFIQTSRTDVYGRVETVPYTFELLTRPGDMKSGPPNTTWAVSFVYPDRLRAAQLAAWRKRKAAGQQAAEEAAKEKAVLAALAAPPPSNCLDEMNWRYGYRGSDVVKPDQVCDDGRTTIVRFNGNRRVPNIYRRLPDGKESIPAYATEPDAMGTTLRIGRTETKWFLRDGDEAGCLFNLGPDPHGASVMTVAEPTGKAATP